MRFVEDVHDFQDAGEVHPCGVAAIYRVSKNTLAIELYANKLLDGRIRKVLVLRILWDRDNWIAAQREVTERFPEITALAVAGETDCSMTIVH